MAKNKKPVWAIDIGNTSLKALQCRIGDEPGTIEALAFDYIEHSKILSQPGAEPAELIAESLETFLSRNSVAKSKVAISVSGQNTISRFLKLPPVDKKKLPDIIQLEAKQWLPFALDDVVWDYQPLIGGSMHGNTLVDSEIGMFAMKREFAARAIVPLETAGIPVDCLQSSPLALYNFAAYDQFDLTQLQGDEEGGTKGFNNYTIILCIGTDSSDVVITNGVKIWVRNITIGGNNFTKALTKGMKLTFSNAEHLKRNAAASQDPKAVFQVMRPVYNELLTEVNRSIEFYSSLDRKAKYTNILAMGNSTKLPGLCQFLRQNLGYEVVPLKKYNKLVSEEVLTVPAFTDNANSFGICYGLALQMLGESAIATNLIPTEVVTKRLIANKKPWILAGAAALMLGFIVPFLQVTRAYTPLQANEMTSAESTAKSVDTKSTNLKSECEGVVTDFKKIDEIGSTLTGNVEGRLLWPELYYVLHQALPQNCPQWDKNGNPVPPKLDGPLALQDRIYITNIEVQKIDDLSTWWDIIKQQPPGTYIADPLELPPEGEETEDSESTSTSTSTLSTSDDTEGGADTKGTGINRAIPPEAPEGKNAYIVQMSFYHYHNPKSGAKDENGNEIEVSIWDFGAAYVRRTLFHNLRYNVVQLPVELSRQSYADNDTAVVDKVTMKEFGFSHPVLLSNDRYYEKTVIDPDALDKAVNDAILKERTQIQKYQSTAPGRVGQGRGTTPGPGGMGGMGGGSMSSYGGGIDSIMGSGGQGSFMGGERNVLIDLAMSNNSGGGGMTPSGIQGQNSGVNEVVSMLKNLNDDQKLDVRKFEGVVQLVWIPKTPTERAEARQELLKAQMEAEAAAGDGLDEISENGTDTTDTDTTTATEGTDENSQPTDTTPDVTTDTTTLPEE